MTPAQQQTLKTHIQANTTVLAFAGGNMTIAANFGAPLVSSSDNLVIASWYNGNASPDFFVWRDLPMSQVLNLITFANMTPADAVPASNAGDALLLWQARSLACQGKQFNLQNLTLGRSTAPMKLGNYRNAMQDCLTQVPAGASGALVAAGWVAVRDAAKGLATNLEKVFATGTGSFASPADSVFEGAVSGDEIHELRSA